MSCGTHLFLERLTSDTGPRALGRDQVNGTAAVGHWADGTEV